MDPKTKQLRMLLEQAQGRVMAYSRQEADPVFGAAYGALAQMARQEVQMLRRILRQMG